VGLLLVVAVASALASSYKAAVLEYSPVFELTRDPLAPSQALKQMLGNLEQYQLYAAQAAEKGAQIIVFPEDGLTGSYFPTRAFISPFSLTIPSDFYLKDSQVLYGFLLRISLTC
jgi:hypothetical protein